MLNILIYQWSFDNMEGGSMTKTQKSIIFWTLALSLIAGIILGPRIYLNYRVGQRIKKTVVVPVYKEGAIAKARMIHAEEMAEIEARKKTEEWEKALIDQYHIIFFFWRDTEEKTAKVLNRIQQNKKLAESLQYAKEQGVFVTFSDNNDFTVRSNSVEIPFQATDEEIITFLLGSSAKDKNGQ